MDTSSTDRRTEVLLRVCDLLPSESARSIRESDPTCYQTFALAYVAIRRNELEVDRDLLEELIRILFDFHDEGASDAYAALEEQPPVSHSLPQRRRRLTLVRTTASLT